MSDFFAVPSMSPGPLVRSFTVPPAALARSFTLHRGEAVSVPGRRRLRAVARGQLPHPRPTGPPCRVLVLEDEESSCELVATYLRGLGCQVDTADRAATALRCAADRPPDLLIADIALPGRRNGLDVVEALRDEFPELPVIVLTGLTSRQLESFSPQLHDCVLLAKPVPLVELEESVRAVMGR